MRVEIVDSQHLGRAEVIGVAALAAEDGSITLIDPGPAVVFAAVQRGLENRGLNPAAVKQVLATHIHLDHSGGAWCWAQSTGARIFAHERGIAHLTDPERLVASAGRIYGHDMDRLWGAVEPIDPRQVTALQDGSEIAVGSRKLRAVDTPGHAQHHMAYWCDEDRLLFAGDVAGVTIDGGPVIPPCPPPDIDVEQWRRSLANLRRLLPARVFVTHFGELKSPEGRLDELEGRLEKRALWIRDQLRRGMTEEALRPAFEQLSFDELRSAGVSEMTLAAYRQADPASMSVTGLIRYWRKLHPEALQPQDAGTQPPQT